MRRVRDAVLGRCVVVTARLTEVTISPRALNTFMRSRQGPVARELLRRGLRVEADAKRRVKVDQGRLRNSITHEFVEGTYGGMRVLIMRIGTNVEYARMVHDGTGIYGPHKSPIVPTHARVLRFKVRDGTIVYRLSVSGQKPNPFLADAMDAARI